jgi:hypothetical protein
MTKPLSPKLEMREKCKHTEGPVGYIQRGYWLEWMGKRFDQFKCPICGLYKIWKRKPSPLVSDKLDVKGKK